jgi:Zn-finger nucleic acid-binding protein
MTVCPKCTYERQTKDDEWVSPLECPNCGIVYEKYIEAQRRLEEETKLKQLQGAKALFEKESSQEERDKTIRRKHYERQWSWIEKPNPEGKRHQILRTTIFTRTMGKNQTKQRKRDDLLNSRRRNIPQDRQPDRT